MFEDVGSDATDGLLGHAGEDGIAHLLEDSGTDTGGAIGEDGGSGHGRGGSTQRVKVDVHAVDDGFEVEWDLDVEDLYSTA